jgi:hypothetical protein
MLWLKSGRLNWYVFITYKHLYINENNMKLLYYYRIIYEYMFVIIWNYNIITNI